MTALWENQIGTDGFEFVEYTAPDVGALHVLFEQMGFRAVARHRAKAVTLYRQGEVNFIVNAEPESHGSRFARAHGPSACAMAFRVHDAAAAYKALLARGARPFANTVGPMELNIPAIEGIGGSVIYLVDRYGEHSIYDVDFVPTDPAKGFAHEGAGLGYIDHVTHNVYRGNMDQWAGFYEKLFNFREIRYFDIEGKLTGLKSRAMTSPDGNIRIPINEPAEGKKKSQVEEYLEFYRGEGVQHVALATNDIVRTVKDLMSRGVEFLKVPNTYYDDLLDRVGHIDEDLEPLKELGILVDRDNEGYLLQLFSKPVEDRPTLFFEIIQRKGAKSFGKGNFKALFEAIEREQEARGNL
ncbi:MAG: 4-hydroxyphenylpyruvate dioxygenase [Alphaproteobacteria bacterium]|nr:4-hydroxyphenylpyruvate dioxygenase [Alphaproteobacteria bacterium]